MPTTRPQNRKKKAKQPSASAKRAIVPQESSNSASPMNRDRLRRLYALMLKCRMVSERSAALFGSGGAAATGYEAAEVGACVHLNFDDRISPTSSMINGYINKGISLVDIFAMLKPSGESSQLGSLSMSAESQILASTTVAVSRKFDGKPIVNMAILGSDGKVENESPDFWKRAIQFAGQHRLGIVYVICTSLTSEHDLRSDALRIQVPGITVDGNDVVAVYRVAEESVRRAREGHGPTLIDCKIDPSRDPLTFMEGYLKKRDLWSDKWHAKVVQGLRRELEQAEKGLA
jgi:TPP-dependent pyruvate/acetoin dehydrogenase alpha subunit